MITITTWNLIYSNSICLLIPGNSLHRTNFLQLLTSEFRLCRVHGIMVYQISQNPQNSECISGSKLPIIKSSWCVIWSKIIIIFFFYINIFMDYIQHTRCHEMLSNVLLHVSRKVTSPNQGRPRIIRPYIYKIKKWPLIQLWFSKLLAPEMW